jgi:hypothetical protein
LREAAVHGFYHIEIENFAHRYQKFFVRARMYGDFNRESCPVKGEVLQKILKAQKAIIDSGRSQ